MEYQSSDNFPLQPPRPEMATNGNEISFVMRLESLPTQTCRYQNQSQLPAEVRWVEPFLGLKPFTFFNEGRIYLQNLLEKTKGWPQAEVSASVSDVNEEEFISEAEPITALTMSKLEDDAKIKRIKKITCALHS